VCRVQVCIPCIAFHITEVHNVDSRGRAVYKRGPHTRIVLPSVLTALLITAQLDGECVENSVRCAVKISGLCNFRTAEHLTANFTL
jgi:hypothetical protein